MEETICKICHEKDGDDGFDFPNENGDIDICGNCNGQIKYLEKDYIPGRKDGIKYIRKKRCNKCNFKLCYINNNIHCWLCWCLKEGPAFYNSGSISRLNQYPQHIISFGKYSGKMLAFILQEDYTYCKWLVTQDYYSDTKLKNIIDYLESDTFGE